MDRMFTSSYGDGLSVPSSTKQICIDASEGFQLDPFQRVLEILLFSLGFHLASLNFCSQTMFLIHSAISCQIHNSTTFFQITQNFKNIWAPIFQKSLNLQLLPIVNSPDLEISFINTADVVIRMNN